MNPQPDRCEQAAYITSMLDNILALCILRVKVFFFRGGNRFQGQGQEFGFKDVICKYDLVSGIVMYSISFKKLLDRHKVPGLLEKKNLVQ